MTVRKAIAKSWFALIGVGLFSAVINTLVLTGSFYMLQVYDRVLPSRSVPTLIGITILLVVLYGAYGALDFARVRALSRIGLGIDRQLRSRVLEAEMLMPCAPARVASRCGRCGTSTKCERFSRGWGRRRCSTCPGYLCT